jgi:hypothetical protein
MLFTRYPPPPPLTFHPPFTHYTHPSHTTTPSVTLLTIRSPHAHNLDSHNTFFPHKQHSSLTPLTLPSSYPFNHATYLPLKEHNIHLNHVLLPHSLSLSPAIHTLSLAFSPHITSTAPTIHTFNNFNTPPPLLPPHPTLLFLCPDVSGANFYSCEVSPVATHAPSRGSACTVGKATNLRRAGGTCGCRTGGHWMDPLRKEKTAQVQMIMSQSKIILIPSEISK